MNRDRSDQEPEQPWDHAVGLLVKEQVIPVATVPDAAAARPLAHALKAGGLSCIEVTLRTDAAEDVIRTLSRETDLIVGAGTVLTEKQAERAISAGARFIVTPGLSARVVRACQDQSIPVIPGVATATEIQAALDQGIRLAKFFPASVLGGTTALRALEAPFPMMRFIPTGGITPESMGSYLRLGCVVAVGASWMVSPDLLAAGNYTEVTRRTRQALSLRILPTGLRKDRERGMSVSIKDRTGRLLIDNAELRLIRSGFSFTEGPAWHYDGRYLIFSDIPGNQMWRWDERNGLASYRCPSSMANGNTFDGQGRLLSCEHATSRLTRAELDGTVTILADRYEGQELNSPNDVIVGPYGDVYFTDPTYGRKEFSGVPRPAVLGFQGLYRIGRGGLELLRRDFAQPNGLCFSLDGTVLYVNDTDRMHIRAFAVTRNGELRGGEVWVETKGDEPGKPDGMKLDSLGNLWCSGPGGIHAFGPGGTLLGTLPVPEVVGNFAWGGDDWRTLFVCASTGLYQIRTAIPGYVPRAGPAV
jgi:gluconolactonase